MFWNKFTAGAKEAPSVTVPPNAPSQSVAQPDLGNAGIPVKFTSVDCEYKQLNIKPIL